MNQNTGLTDAEVDQFLRDCAANNTPSPTIAHRTESCPASIRFLLEENTWTALEHSHIESCEHCLRKLRASKAAVQLEAKTGLKSDPLTASYFLGALAAASETVETSDDRQVIIRGFECRLTKWLDREVYVIRIVGPAELCGVRMQVFINSMEGRSREDVFSQETSEKATFEVEFPKSETGEIVKIIPRVVE